MELDSSKRIDVEAHNIFWMLYIWGEKHWAGIEKIEKFKISPRSRVTSRFFELTVRESSIERSIQKEGPEAIASHPRDGSKAGTHPLSLVLSRVCRARYGYQSVQSETEERA